MDAAERARAGKAAKALALSALGSGRMSPSQAVLAPPKSLWATSVSDVLLACHGIGGVRCREICEAARVWPLTSLGDLSSDERQRLSTELTRSTT